MNLGSIYGDTDTLGSTFDDWAIPDWGSGSSSGGGSGGGVNWNNIYNQAVGLTSQIVGAWGHNQTQQFYPGVGPIGGGYNPTSILTASGIAQQQYAAQYGQNGQGVGSSVGGGIDGIINWATQNPIPVFLGIAGIFLLMRQPPGNSRRG